MRALSLRKGLLCSTRTLGLARPTATVFAPSASAPVQRTSSGASKPRTSISSSGGGGSSRRRAMSDAKRRRMVAGAGPSNAGGGDADGGAGAHSVTGGFKIPGLIATDHVIRVPLDYSGRTSGEINVFVRELVTPNNARRSLPAILYLQGGPGFESPRPSEASGWIKSAANNFRVLLMDPRGTGLSSQISVKNLAKAGGAKEQAKYLTFFRADSIVRDAERVRQALVPKSSGDGRWTILGQSFGGFCAMTYMSIAPDGLTDALLTGGIPPAISDACPADRTYRALYQRVLLQNRRYYARFPSDVGLVQRIVRYLAAQPGGGPLLPTGTRLTPRAFQLLGLSGLGSSGGFERLHYLLEAFFDGDGDMSPFFARSFEGWMPWDTNPIYALLHEPIYCQGAASNWSAHRVREQEFKDEFDAVALAQKGEAVNFTGEMVYPWMFEDFAALKPYAAAANLLAAKADWGRLYDVEALRSNVVPCAAALYLEDMYVDYDLAQETAQHVRGLRQWATNEYKHSGIRDDGARILDRLLSMARDMILVE